MSTIINKQVKLTTGGSISFAQYSGGSITADSSNLIITGSLKNSSNIAYATEDYVQTYAEGLSVKESVRVATTANLTYSWSSGTFSGVNPTPTIDTITIADGNRILIKNQTNPEENGIYIFNDTANTLSRTTDFDEPTDNVKGSFTFVQEGSQAGTGWVCTTTGSVTINTTPINFSQFSGATVSHSSLSGLSADDHAQYALLAGRSGGQILTGGTASSNNLVLRSTSNGTKGSILIEESTNSTSTSTGALVVSGGVGIGSAMYVGGQVNATDATTSTSSSTGALVVTGGVGISTTTDATDHLQGGALTVAGGVGIAKKLYVGNQTLIVNPTANTVGIGTNNPSVPLDVVGAAAFSSTVNVTGDLTVGVGTTNPSLQVLSTGNVGIGKTDPSVPLDIVGNVSLTGGEVSGYIGVEVPLDLLVDVDTEVNCDSANISRVSGTNYIRKINNEYEYSVVIKVSEVTSAITTTSFQITLPEAITFSDKFSLVGFCSGFVTDNDSNTIISNVENCYICSVPSSTRALISFTSSSNVTDDIYLQVLIRYTKTSL